MIHENYIIRKSTEEDKREIINLQEDRLKIDNLRKSYIDQNKAKISPGDEKLAHYYMKNSLEKSVTKYPCLVAVHKETQKIIGMVLLVTEEESVKTDNITSVKCKIERNVMPFINFLVESAKINLKYPNAKKFIKIKYLFVHKDHGQKGLATSLVEEAIQWGRENNFDLVFGNFSSAFSQKAARKAEMKSIFDYDIRDYRNSDGLQVFADADIHNVVSVMAIDLHK